ncbi:MAG: hypothetical protein U0793_32420 [Gemmataceae bacterium]
MNDALTQVVVWLNAAANALGYLLYPIAWLPGWLSATLVGVLSGIGLLAVFKYTSNQRAIKNVRRDMRASRLSAKLFEGGAGAAFRSLFGVLWGALRLLLLAIVPILVMIIPVTLLFGQLALWYQARPLRVGEETTITVKLRAASESTLPPAKLEASDAIEDLTGAVRVFKNGVVCWTVVPRKEGNHVLRFQIDGRTVEKQVAIGRGFMPVSLRRPAWDWSDALLHPREQAFPAEAVVESIDIEYPDRSGFSCGTNTWLWYWFIVSLIAGFAFKGVLRTNL